MVLEIASIAGNGGKSSGPTETSAAALSRDVRPMMRADQKSAKAEPGRVELAYAVEPTPVTATAAKIDLEHEKSRGETVFEYPVFGPDRFARVAAEHAIAKAEDRNEAMAEAKPAPDEEAAKAERAMPTGAPDAVEEAPVREPEADKVAMRTPEPVEQRAAPEPKPEPAAAEQPQE